MIRILGIPCGTAADACAVRNSQSGFKTAGLPIFDFQLPNCQITHLPNSFWRPIAFTATRTEFSKWVGIMALRSLRHNVNNAAILRADLVPSSWRREVALEMVSAANCQLVILCIGHHIAVIPGRGEKLNSHLVALGI